VPSSRPGAPTTPGTASRRSRAPRSSSVAATTTSPRPGTVPPWHHASRGRAARLRRRPRLLRPGSPRHPRHHQVSVCAPGVDLTVAR
jgi:hypothetical protein